MEVKIRTSDAAHEEEFTRASRLQCAGLLRAMADKLETGKAIPRFVTAIAEIAEMEPEQSKDDPDVFYATYRQTGIKTFVIELQYF